MSCCPTCNGKSKVVDSRPTKRSIRRRRSCISCSYMWVTYELTEDLEGLLKSVVDRCEPLRKRLRHIESEMYELGKALRHIQTASAEPSGYTLPRGRPRQARANMWSNLELETLDASYNEYGAGVLAKRLGRSKLSVYQQARKRGLTRGRKHASTYKAEDLPEHQQGREVGCTTEASSSDCTEQSDHG